MEGSVQWSGVSHEMNSISSQIQTQEPMLQSQEC